MVDPSTGRASNIGQSQPDPEEQQIFVNILRFFLTGELAHQLTDCKNGSATLLFRGWQCIIGALKEAASQAAASLGLGEDFSGTLRVRLVHVPGRSFERPSVSTLRVRDRGHFVRIAGTVTRAGPVKVVQEWRAFRCETCGHTFSCRASPTCGYEFEQCMADFQEIRVQDDMQAMGVGVVPQSCAVTVFGDLVGVAQPGDSVVVEGVPETEDTFRRFWSDWSDEWQGRQALVAATAPWLSGLPVPKLALLLTLVGGNAALKGARSPRGIERFSLRGFLFQPRGPSGHSWWRKARFAMSLFSPFGMMGVVGVAKDIFLEKFGLDAKTFSLLVTIASFWGPFQDMFMGRLQDREARCIISFEAARQQVYPFKEERISVEGLCKYSCMAGGGAGGLVFLVLSKDASIAVRLAFVLYIIPVGLLSLEAVPLFREARQSSELHNAEVQETAGLLQVLWEVIVGAGGAAGVTEAVMNLVYVHLFTKDDSLTDVTGKSDRRLLYWVVTFRLINAALTFLLIGFLQPSVPLMFLWSIIFGALSMSQILAAAIFSSLTFMGLGLAGFQTKNCEAACIAEGLGGDSDCTDTCFRGVIDSQPESLRLYVRFVIGIFAPICELMIALHAFKFPIKNARLRRLYLRKAAERGDNVEDEAKTPGPPYAAKSQIVLLDEVPDAPNEADSSTRGRDFAAASFIDRLVHTVAMIGQLSGSSGRSLTVRFAAETSLPEDGKEDASSADLSTRASASTRYSL
eukprot:g9698.t1